MTSYIGRILRLPEVLFRTGYSRTMLYEKIKKGEFPKAIALGKRAVGWYEPEVDAHIIERIQNGRDPEGV